MLKIRALSSLAEVKPATWNALANPPNRLFDPFVSHAFLYALEQSGCVSNETGWMPMHLLAEDESGQVTGAIPLYLKSHSLGEYVFDHGWAAAFEQAGGQYYPKLQSSIPFTPAAGPRLLAGDDKTKAALVSGMEQMVARIGVNSAHLTFADETDSGALRKANWLERKGLQFHFINDGYGDYEDFLAKLTSRKRKALRTERRKANEDVEICGFSGADLTTELWDAFYGFYQDTGLRKWGSPYLNRTFFDLIGQNMGEQILLLMARRDGKWIAGALNFIGGNCLFGRYWGCLEHQDSLHFELCYHRAIEYAIAHGLERVEAGAQGAHKIARGYLPVLTRSFHHIPNPGFADAVSRFLAAETAEMRLEQEACAALSPYRQIAT